MMTNLQKRSQLNFALLLLQVLTDRKPVAELLSHPEFLKRCMGICKRLAYGTDYDPRDMFQDLCLRLLTYGPRLLPTNLPDEGAFFRWLIIVARNLLFDYFRKNGKRLRVEDSLDDVLLDALEIADPGGGPELDCLFGEFEDFVETLPDDARLAIALRRKGLTFDEIGDELNCSNVTARKLVRNAREEFFGGDKAAVRKSIKRAV